MASRGPNLKVEALMDVRGIETGTKKAAQAVKDLNKSASGAMSSLGNALGIPVDKLKQLSNAVQGAGVKFQQMAGTDMKPMIASLAKVAGGVAALGIGAAVAAFKELNRLAESYASTIEGAGTALATQAYIDQFRKSIDGQLNGEDALNKISGWKKFWGTLGSNIRGYMNDMSKSKMQASDFAAIAIATGTSGSPTIEKAKSDANNAAVLARDLYALQLKMNEDMLTITKLDVDIAQNLNVAKDKIGSTIAERQQAMEKIEASINTKYDLKIRNQRELVRILEEGYAMMGSKPQDQAEYMQAQSELIRLEAQRATEKRQLLEIQTSIVEAQKKEAKAAKEALEIEQSRKAWKESLLPTLDFSDLTDPLKGKSLELPKATIKVEVEAPAEEELVMIGDKIQSLIDSAFSGLGENIAEIITGNMTGGEALLSMLGELAVSAGRLAIGIGTSLLAVKESLKTLNPYVAIGAGVALVALGTLAKKSVTALGSSMGQGSYSSSSLGNTYSATGSGDLATREMTVNVTGTLTGEGTQLVAVINNVDKKRQYTT